MPQLPHIEKSLWRESYPSATPIYPPLSEDLPVDVVVIGGGISGLTTAYLLKQAGKTVAVLEKATIGGGTSGRTTGKVTSQHNLTYYDLRDRLGERAARLYGQANQTALEQIETIIEAENITCDWQREDNYVFTADARQLRNFRREAAVAADLGLPASFETSTPLPFEVKAAVRFADQAKINTQKYLLGLAQSVHGDGCYIFEASNVTHIHHRSDAFVKANGATVHARHIVVATNVPTLPLAARGAYCMLEYPKESYIIAGLLPEKQPGMYISPDDSHFSILPVHTEGEDRILIGGRDHISGLRGSTEARYRQLADYAAEHFGVTTITHKWSDRDYLAYDNVPLIGKLYPWSDNLFVATAMKKWGLSNGTVAGILLRDLILGVPNEWASVFNANRSRPIQSIPRVMGEYLTGKG